MPWGEAEDSFVVVVVVFVFVVFFLVKGEGSKSLSKPETERDMYQTSNQSLSSCSVNKLRAKCLCHNSFGSFIATIDL